MITIITPIHKLSFLENTLDNYHRQLHLESELLLILNGEMIDYKNKIPSYVKTIKTILAGKQSLGSLRNIGLNWMEENDRSKFSWFDADDYYGENYLKEAIDKLEEGYDLVGKLDYRFKINDDIYLIKNIVKGNIVHGPTMTGYLSDLRFPDLDLAEDNLFISNHKKIGFTSSDNWIYNVRDDSIQERSSTRFLEGMKFYNTQTKNVNCCIYKNDEIYWTYGMGFDFEKMRD